MPNIEAVIWDFGGVLTTSPFEAFNRYEAEQGLPKDFIRTLNATNPDDNAWAKFERSEIDIEGFDALFFEESAAQGHPISGKAVIDLLHGDLRESVVAALKACKQRYKVGCITNNVQPKDQENFWASGERATAIQGVMDLFDHIIESSKAGVRKPDPRIYSMMTQALDVAPEACVYLDDLGVNCKPARTLGMATIKVTSGEQAVADLEAALGHSLR